MITSMDTAFCLKGRTAIITGGDTGIGFGIAEAMAQEGANIAIFCRNEKRAAEALEKLAKYEGKARFYRTDITDFENCKASVDAVLADYGKIDILVNNGGVAAMGGVLDYPEDLTEWFRCIDVDLNGAFRLCYLVGKHMRDQGKGKVINVTSNSGEMCNIPSFTPYNVAKAGLNRLTKCLAWEWGPYHINVNAIAPGYTHSNLSSNAPKEVGEMLTERIPYGRYGEPIEIGALAVYLASDASDIMTGAVLTIDGGYSLAR
ncbi:MAG: SDR family oxidoreductase [Oscillospiraceae bacterium]|nr:SDR family oxidoreductase [Oscillospiraceae bacterium]